MASLIQDGFADFLVLGISEFLAEVLFHESDVAVDGLDPSLAAGLLIYPARVSAIVDEFSQSVPEVFFRIGGELPDVLRDFQAFGADLRALFAVEDVVLGGLDEVGAHQLRLDDVLHALDGRHEVRELALDPDELGEYLSGDQMRVIERAFMHGIHAFEYGIGDLLYVERHDPSVSLDNGGDDDCLPRWSSRGLLLGHIILHGLRRNVKNFDKIRRNELKFNLISFYAVPEYKKSGDKC